MLAQMHSFVLTGIDPLAYEVEVDTPYLSGMRNGKVHGPLVSSAQKDI